MCVCRYKKHSLSVCTFYKIMLLMQIIFDINLLYILQPCTYVHVRYHTYLKTKRSMTFLLNKQTGER